MKYLLACLSLIALNHLVRLKYYFSSWSCDDPMLAQIGRLDDDYDLGEKLSNEQKD